MSQADQWQHSVARVWSEPVQGAKTYLGTAFFVSARYLLTAKHVVEKEDSARLFICDAGVMLGGQRSIKHIKFHGKQDVALLELSEPIRNLGDTLALGYVEQQLADKKLILAGFFNEAGDLDRAPRDCSSYEDKYGWYITRPGVDSGMSGGPAILGNRLAGIIRATAKDSARIVPFDAFKDLLDNIGLLSSGSASQFNASSTKRSDSTYATQATAASNQKPLKPLDLSRYEDQLRRDLEKAFSDERLQPAASLLCDHLPRVSPRDATKALFQSNDELDAVHEWNGVMARLAHEPEAGLSVMREAWSACEKVHLLLLPRLVNPAWLDTRKHVDGDRMLFSLSIRHNPPNRVVDLIFACLDEKNAIRFEHRGKAEEHDLAVPKFQIDVTAEGLQHSSTPDPARAVERVGLRLWEEYGLGRPPPERMRDKDWRKLDAKLKAARYAQRLFYIVIPEADQYADEAILVQLYHYLPNLPKFLLLDAGGDPSPFNCDAEELSAAIGEFWHMKPTELP